MTKTRRTLAQPLRAIGACEEAIEWAKDFRSAQAAWNACERGDWMLWVIGRTINCPPWSDGRKLLLAAALDCAETVKHLWPNSQKQKIGDAITVLRSWIGGGATTEQAKEARKSLYDAAADAAAYATYAAADAAAAYAAAATYAAAYATYAAADAAAAYAATYAATYAAAAYAAAATYAARENCLKECADIVRRHYPKPPKARK